MRDFGEVEQLQVSKKGPADFVSSADLKVEEKLVRELTKARPDFGFLLEEKGAIEGRNGACRWIIDPLDGTTNFLHGIPHFAISIALERQGEIVAGIIYQPLTDELFWADRNRGAWINDRRLRVSGRKELQQSVIGTGIPHLGRGDAASFSAILSNVMPRVAGVRRFGAASLDLAWVAAGRLDGFWEEGLSLWDIAAGTLILREAGGLVSDMDGSGRYLKTGNIVCANGALHKPLLALVRDGLKTAAG